MIKSDSTLYIQGACLFARCIWCGLFEFMLLSALMSFSDGFLCLFLMIALASYVSVDGIVYLL